MTCPECGSLNTSGSDICRNCGFLQTQDLEQDSETTQCLQCGQTFHVSEMVPHGKYQLCENCKEFFFMDVREMSKQRLTFDSEVYAGLVERFSAFFIDNMILTFCGFLFFGVITIITGVMGNDLNDIQRMTSTRFKLFFIINSFIIPWLYFTLMESSRKQATIGKMALGIIVTDYDGRRISWWKANIRFWSKIISSLTIYFGYIIVAFTERKQALHDMIAKTLVVKK
jgi:uncharacterized RDD family membrane protein YckC